MANSKAILDEIRKDLVKARVKDKPVKAKQLIEELAEDIQKQIDGGASLAQIYEIIRARLPDEIKLTLGSFRKYWTNSRNSSGLLGKRTRASKNNAAPPLETKNNSYNVNEGQPLSVAPAKTADKFRKDPDNI
jgi:hypothetical protein